MRLWVLSFLICAFFSPSSFAASAVSCTLDHPDQDVKRIIPESTSYRVRDLMIFRHGSKELMKSLEKDMSGPLDPEFETAETPYTFYVAYRGKQYIGLILGTTSRAVDGPMQVFVAYRPDGRVREVYVQKISSADASAFRSKYYREQFHKFSVSNLIEEPYAKPPVRSPSNDTIKNHHAFIRAVRLNLLLVRDLYNKFVDR